MSRNTLVTPDKKDAIIAKALARPGYYSAYNLATMFNVHSNSIYKWAEKGLPHYRGDVRDLITEYFDLIIFHPVCKFIANSGVRWLEGNTQRMNDLAQAIVFFNLRHKFNSPRIATENPIPHRYAVDGLHITGQEDYFNSALNTSKTGIGKYDQIFQPWHFGHKKMKATCLWLKGLPKLKYTNVVGPPPKDKKERYKWQDVWTASPGPDRERLRSVTYQGVADAIADQYGNLPI